MNHLLTIAITLVVLLGLSFGITYFTNSSFRDFSFLIGLLSAVILGCFTFLRGFASQNLDDSVQATTEFEMEKQKVGFSPKIACFTCLAYTIIIFVIGLSEAGGACACGPV